MRLYLRKGLALKSWHEGCEGKIIHHRDTESQRKPHKKFSVSLCLCGEKVYWFCCRLAGGTIPFMRRYSTICP